MFNSNRIGFFNDHKKQHGEDDNKNVLSSHKEEESKEKTQTNRSSIQMVNSV